MPTVDWLAGASGDWSKGTLWSGGTAPNSPLVDAVIDALSVAGSYTVAVDPGASFLVDSLLVNTAQSASGIADSGTITVDGSAAIDSGLIDLTGELSAESVAVGGGLALAGGLLNATELTIDPSGSMGGYGNIAVGDTLAVGGLVDVSTGDLTLIANLMTLDGGQLDAGSGTLTLQVASFANLSGGALSGGNFEADNGGFLMLPQNAGITALQNTDLFLAGSGTIAYFDNSTGSIQAIQTELQSIDSLSELLIVGGATFAAQNPLLLDGRIDVVDGLLDAPGLTIDPSGLLLGIGIVEADNGTIINNGEILSGTGITSSLGNTVGDLLILGSVQGTGDLNVNVGTLELSTGSTEDVTLLGGGVLQLDAPMTPGGSLYTGTITNRGATRAAPAVIDLPNLVPTSLTIGYTNVAGGAVVTARDNGATVAAFTFAGTHDLGEFTLGDDAFGGTEMTVACYAAGTRIKTDVGEMPIESLRPGDRLVTADNQALPVTWLGHRDICCDRHREPALVWPVRVRAGAFGDLLPGRDLWLSPDHAVFAVGVLIPVKCLINGASIVQVPVDRVTYWHVELSRHAVIFANGLAAESYLDTGNRAMFVNGASHLVLHPDFTALGWENACARLVTDGPEIAAVSCHLRARVRQFGWRGARDPVGVRVGGHTLRAVRSHAGRHSFLLPQGTRLVQLETPPAARIDGILLAGRALRDNDPAVVSGLARFGGAHPAWCCVEGTAELAVPSSGGVLEIRTAADQQHSAGRVPLAAYGSRAAS